MKLLPAFSTVALAVCAACSSSQTNGTTPIGNGGVPSGGAATGGSSAGQAGSATVAGATAGGASGSGTVVGGSGGTAPGGSGAGGVPIGGTGGAAAGAGGLAGGNGGATLGGAGGGGATSVGGGVAAGCTADPHPLCLDFESAIDKATWTGGSDAAVSTMDKAHGTHSYHAYPNAGVLTTIKLGTITNDMWGRFYLRMTPGNKNPPGPAPAGTPGAPGGHGNIVGAFEGGAWYEIGWQFNGLMGVWHNGGENPLRSHPNIMDQWYCVELHFDGTKTDMPTWYVDSAMVEYYMGEPNNNTKPHVITKFDKITIGFTSYAGLGINPMPYGNNNDPVLTDMWLDDIAFDTKRIGCIAP